MMFPDAVAAVLRDYPRIFFACHRRHTRDPKTGELVSEKQVQLLDHLDEIHALSLSSLADHMGVTPGTMSVAVDRLVRRGFIARIPDSADRRRVLLRLTESGARVCEAHSVLDPGLVDEMVVSVPEPERARALEGLSLLSRAAAASQRTWSLRTQEHSA